MKHLVKNAVVTAIAWVGMLTALSTRPITAADDPATDADKVLISAFERQDKTAIEKYLDPDFTWIDHNGTMVFRSDALALNMKPLVGEGAGVEVIGHPYGDRVVWLQAHSGDNYAARFWVKRASGWRLLHTTEITARQAEARIRPTYDIPCVNPCKELPIRTLDESQAAAMAGWQEQESSRQGWLKHVADDNEAVLTYGGKRQRKKDMTNPPPRPPGAPMVGADPVLFARLWTFGPDTVIMIACQPAYGEKAYWASRVFHYQSGTWQMAESYHNNIQASGVMIEVQGK
jgi:hypothetical protein